MAVTAHADKCSSLSQQSILYDEKKIRHKALSKMQTAKIKSIRLFHTFCFYTYVAAHPVVLVCWSSDGLEKMLGEMSMCISSSLIFFQSGGLHKCSHRLLLSLNGQYYALQGHILHCTQMQMHGIFCLRGLMGLRLTYLR